MPQYPTKFIRDPSKKRTWYIHHVIDGEESHADDIEDYKWHFGSEDAAKKAVRRLAKFNLKAMMKVDNNFPESSTSLRGTDAYIISVSFKSDEDEAEFMLKALSNQITLYHSW